MKDTLLTRLISRAALLGITLSLATIGPAAAYGQAEQRAESDKLDSDQALSAKLGSYIRCFNSTSNRAHDCKRRYLSWADATKGPTGNERNIYGVYTIDPDTCSKEIPPAKTMAPSITELDQAGESYLKAITELAAVLKKADRYYEQEDYKDDSMAEGKKLHAPLLSAFAEFEKSDAALNAQIDTLNDQLTQRRLSRMAADQAQQLRYLTEKTLYDGKRLTKLANISALPELKTDLFGSALESYNASIQALEDYADSHKPEVEKVMTFSVIISAMQDLQKSAKELMRRKRENRDFNKEFFSQSSPTLVHGHPAEVIEKYNALVTRSNFSRF